MNSDLELDSDFLKCYCSFCVLGPKKSGLLCFIFFHAGLYSFLLHPYFPFIFSCVCSTFSMICRNFNHPLEPVLFTHIYARSASEHTCSSYVIGVAAGESAECMWLGWVWSLYRGDPAWCLLGSRCGRGRSFLLGAKWRSMKMKLTENCRGVRVILKVTQRKKESREDD